MSTRTGPSPPEDVSLDELLELGAERDRSGRHRRRRRRRVLLVVATCVLLLTLIPLGVGYHYVHRLDDNLQRISGVFDDLPDRPPRATGPAADSVNILVLGTDRRSRLPTTGSEAGAPAWVSGQQRSDTMMLVHLDADRSAPTVISLPRDSWVRVPGHGRAKINAAYSYGGPRLAVQTVERLTGVRIDHLAVVDWSGFVELTDSVGGIPVYIRHTVHDPVRGITWTEGSHVLDGDQALAYVGQRHGLPRGDLDRVRRQQVFLRTLLRNVLHQELATSPTALYGLLDTISRHASVDDDWSMPDMAALAWSTRDLRSANVAYLTAPVAGLDRAEGQSVVRLDRPAGRSLWRAVRDDTVTEWLAEHPDTLTPDAVR